MAGSNAAAQRGSMNGYAKSAQTKVADKVKQKTASVKASSSSVSKSASSATASVKSKASAAAASASTPSAAKQGVSKKEIDERLKSLKAKMDAQGEKSYKNLKAEVRFPRRRYMLSADPSSLLRYMTSLSRRHCPR